MSICSASSSATRPRSTLYLRGIHRSQRTIVSSSSRTKDTPVCERVGLRVFTEDDLDLQPRRISNSPRSADPAGPRVAHQGRTLHAGDAVGAPLNSARAWT